MAKKPWEPLRRSHLLPPCEATIKEWMKYQPELTREQMIAYCEKEDEVCTYWVNDTYQVGVRPMGEGYVNINIRRRDGGTIFRDWRIFQRIKNEIVGPECEAVELYPAESRLADTSNKYHLFACTKPGWRFPFGYEERQVSDGPGTTPGTRQRPRSNMTTGNSPQFPPAVTNCPISNTLGETA